MGFLRKLVKGLLGGGGGQRAGTMMEFAVRCDRCGEVICGQINLNNDLSVEYDGDDRYYFCRKGLVGGGETRCFQQITVEYTFDARRQVIDRRAEGGRFVDLSEGGALSGESPA
jgi:hypothetical protein